MDIILNDKSLNGQFKCIEDFTEVIIETFLPILKEMEQRKYEIYKRVDTYQLYITSDTVLQDFLKIKGDAVIQKLKRTLAQLYSTDPFWNLEPRTKRDIVYQCKYERDIPNCFTETVERNGLLLSFQHEDFIESFLEIERDGIPNKIRNTYNILQFHYHLDDLGIVDIWKDNSFIILDKYKFEIRFEESHHNKAHFHVSMSENSISISIPELEILAGGLGKNNEKIIMNWAENNIEKIKTLWMKIHGDRIQV